MGSIATGLGFGAAGDSGSAGTNFNASSANIINPVKDGQTDTAYANAQSGITQQQAFLNAVGAQGGLANQSQVYNQLQGIANGTGPNPAAAQLAQATGANTANQAALMAGQRGAAQNVGLIARQAAQQGAANQQNSIGQAATLQAQQSLNAVGQAGTIAGQQVTNQQNALTAYNSAAQSEQANLFGSLANVNQSATANQQSVNNSNSNVAAKGAGQGLLGSITGGTMLAHGGQVKAHYADGGLTSVAPQAPAPHPQLMSLLAPRTTGAIQRISDLGKGISDLFGSAPNAASTATGAESMVATPDAGAATGASTATDSNMGASLTGADAAAGAADTAAAAGTAADASAAAGAADASGEIGLLAALSKGGRVPAMVSPGEISLSPKEAAAVVDKGKSPMKVGERIPGKAKVPGNSLKNDTVPKTLEEGGIIIPRSAAGNEDKAAAFVAAHFKRKGLRRG